MATAASTSGRPRPRTRRPGFHIVIRNNVSYQNGEWNIANPTDGEGIILDTFDYADSTYGTTPYHQQSLVENNVVWGNGGRGIEVAGAGPTSYVTVRNNTVFDDNRQQLPWAGGEIVSIGNHNEFYDNIAIVGPDEKDGPNGGGLTVALEDGCGTQGGVAVTTGSVWQGNVAYSMLTGNRLSYSSCPAPISATANMLGVDPALAAPSMTATSAQAFRLGASSPAAHAGTAHELRPLRLRLRDAARPAVDWRVRALRACQPHAPGPEVHAAESLVRGTQWPPSHWSVAVQ